MQLLQALLLSLFLTELDPLLLLLALPLHHFYHKQVIDRVLAAPASLHSPSHYDQLALFSLFTAIEGGRGGKVRPYLSTA